MGVEASSGENLYHKLRHTRLAFPPLDNLEWRVNRSAESMASQNKDGRIGQMWSTFWRFNDLHQTHTLDRRLLRLVRAPLTGPHTRATFLANTRATFLAN
jgi:hypothetical protein